MNIQQAKAAFKALYLWQPIGARCKADEKYPIILLPQHLTDDRIYLLLRSIDQLTDEQLIVIAKLAYGSLWTNQCRAKKVENLPNVHPDIASVEIEFFMDHPDINQWIKACHIQIDLVDPDVNMLRFSPDGKHDDVIGSEEQWAIKAYLTDIGILLPFTYLDDNNKPVMLSVHEILDLGWAKIKQD